jgi:hypothetical protein
MQLNIDVACMMNILLVLKVAIMRAITWSDRNRHAEHETTLTTSSIL